jgi:hypothetical protein
MQSLDTTRANFSNVVSDCCLEEILTVLLPERVLLYICSMLCGRTIIRSTGNAVFRALGMIWPDAANWTVPVLALNALCVSNAELERKD